MRKCTFIFILVFMALGLVSWMPDRLGHGFEMRYVDQGTDYSGSVRSTIIRRNADVPGKKAVLYVHGFNDYFFQSELADSFNAHGYDFYAVDLRKYGRSLIEGQTPFQVHDFKEYTADIDSALAEIRRNGDSEIVLMGHSTGGLTTSFYLAECGVAPDIKALVLNSPFLDWNLDKFTEKILVPAVRSFAPLAKGLKIPQGGDTRYAYSLLKGHGGEWDFDTTWKMPHSPAVEASWIAAVDKAQDVVQNYPNLAVPILLMHSGESTKKDSPDSLWHSADAVLDVEDISVYGRRLGLDVTEISVNGGLHDLFLSAPEVRKVLYIYLFKWLDARGI